jgi:hypothetical protein
MSEMLKELAQSKESAKHTAATGEGGNPNGQADELPEGSSPLEARPEAPEVEEESAEEAPVDESESSDEPAKAAAGAKIRIGGREFESQEEAFKYAEQLERDNEITNAHAAGIREALEATRGPAQPQEEPEEDFDAKFYANPKETLKEIQAKATQDAIALIRAETQREKVWSDFLNEYPDIRRKDAERILSENADTIGKMTDLAAAQKKIAQKVREEYREIQDLMKPRTELKSSKQALSPSGGAGKGVTPKKSEEKPLSFAEQIRQNRISR